MARRSSRSVSLLLARAAQKLSARGFVPSKKIISRQAVIIMAKWPKKKAVDEECKFDHLSTAGGYLAAAWLHELDE